MLLLVTGASGVGKTTARIHATKLLDATFEAAELWHLGPVPAVPTVRWRQQQVDVAVRRATELARQGRHLLLAGDPIPAGEVLAAPSAGEVDVAVCLSMPTPGASRRDWMRGGIRPSSVTCTSASPIRCGCTLSIRHTSLSCHHGLVGADALGPSGRTRTRPRMGHDCYRHHRHSGRTGRGIRRRLVPARRARCGSHLLRWMAPHRLLIGRLAARWGSPATYAVRSQVPQRGGQPTFSKSAVVW